MKKKLTRGKVLMAVGLILLVGAGSLLAYNRWEDYHAGRVSSEAASVLSEEISAGELDVHMVSRSKPRSSEDDEITEESIPSVELDGAYYMGLLEIPRLNRVLPVQSSYTLDALRTSPCRFSGSIKEGGLVICAHNYRQHFGGLSSLVQGDSIILTDLAGQQFFYEVQEIYIVQPTDIEGMIDSGYDLTLFTCNYGGSARVTVRCSLAQ